MLDVWAANAVAMTEALAAGDPSWSSTWFRFVDGVVVLQGIGLYVNRAVRVGIDAEPTEDDWTTFEQRADDVGVDAAFEVTPLTRESVVRRLRDRGFGPDGVVAASARRLDDLDRLDPDPLASVGVVVERGGAALEEWRATAAEGWGHADGLARRASDAFALAAAEVDGDGFLLVRDAADGRPVACASVTIRDRLATLGGMTTVPSARGRGIQSAMIVHRLRLAAAAGCDLATTTARPDGASARNLRRHGFAPVFDIVTWTRPH